jgi:hypothetical protein
VVQLGRWRAGDQRHPRVEAVRRVHQSSGRTIGGF